jgi:hypothetical protein
VLTVNQWLASVPAARKHAIKAVRNAINAHLPQGYEETVDWGMLAWVVPLATLPNTHNGRPLLFVALGAHRKLMTVYLGSVYGDAELWKEFEVAYKRTGKKLHIGGSCVHFRVLDDLPLEVVGNTIARIPVDQYVARYKNSRPEMNPKKETKARTKKAKQAT